MKMDILFHFNEIDAVDNFYTRKKSLLHSLLVLQSMTFHSYDVSQVHACDVEHFAGWSLLFTYTVIR